MTRAKMDQTIEPDGIIPPNYGPVSQRLELLRKPALVVIDEAS